MNREIEALPQGRGPQSDDEVSRDHCVSWLDVVCAWGAVVVLALLGLVAY